MEELLQVIKDYVKRKVINLGRRAGRLKTPMDMVILALQTYGILPQNLTALELFGMHGLWVTVDYAYLCNYLELWEINPTYCKFAQKFLPKATVKIGDSIDAVKKGKLLRDDYNFIVIDNPIGGTFGSGKYCEHFDIFPALIKRVAGRSIFIITTVLDTGAIVNRYPSVSIENWLIRRKEFYGIKNEAEIRKIGVNKLKELYINKFKSWNVNVENIFFTPRDKPVGFLTVEITREEG